MCFSQEEFDPADPSNPCVNYPTEKYRSYADCDDQFVRRTFPPDLRPFWTVDNMSEASSNYTTRPGEQLEDFGYGDSLSVWSTLIGRGPSRLCQLSYDIKTQLKAPKDTTKGNKQNGGLELCLYGIRELA